MCDIGVVFKLNGEKNNYASFPIKQKKKSYKMSMIQLIHPIMILFHTNSLIICLKYSICINCINLLKIVNKGAVKVTSDWTVLEKRIYLEYKLFKNRHVNVI